MSSVMENDSRANWPGRKVNGGRPDRQHERWAGLAVLVPVLLLLVATGKVSAQGDFQGASHLMPFEEDTIKYGKSPETGPVARLQERLERGEIKLQHDARFGYLPSLLEALKVPRASQMLVFSKTSFQRDRISPKQPRAIYFSDDVYIGYVVGSSLLEMTSVDPKLGGVFYTMEQTLTEKPKFVRTDQCLECHASAKTMGVPGHLVRSFSTDANGSVDLTSGTSLVNHRTPFAERWGGWYVTGQHGDQRHRGNLFGDALDVEQKQPNHLGNLHRLDRFFDVSQHLVPTSDIVALMVMEHQTHMHNFITRLNFEATVALQQYGHIKYLKNVLDGFVRYLLFAEEAALTAPVRGSREFAEAFTANGPRDQKGRSLRDLDLQTRLFKYPCSYLIYSDAFEQLPKVVRDDIYQRMLEVLSGRDDRAVFDGLSRASRRAVREILAETKRDLPANWTETSAAASKVPPASTVPPTVTR
jgi:hypothetical protein